MSDDTFYEVLGVSPSASQKEIEAAYRRLVRLTHPDAGGSDFLFRRVHEAHSTLVDPVKRRAYDARLREPVTEEEPAPGDSGWVRVDDPPGWSPNSGATGTDSDDGNPSGSAPPPPADEPRRAPPDPAPGVMSVSGLRAQTFVARHPWVVVLVAGLLLGRFVPALGTLFIVVGGLAAVGSRRGARRHALRYSDTRTVDAMDGTSFEDYVGELFRRQGCWVQLVGQAHDFGADLLVNRDGRRVVVQTKRYSSSVGVDAVREVAAARAHYGADDAIVVTNSYFTGPAVQLARSNHVELWDRVALSDMARRASGQTTSPVSLLWSEFVAGASIVFAVLSIMAAVPGSTTRRSRGRARGRSRGRSRKR